MIDLLPPTDKMQDIFGPNTVGYLTAQMPLQILEHRMHHILVQIVALGALNEALQFAGEEPQSSLFEANKACRRSRLIEDRAHYAIKSLNTEANAAKHGEKRRGGALDRPRRKWRRS